MSESLRARRSTRTRRRSGSAEVGVHEVHGAEPGSHFAAPVLAGDASNTQAGTFKSAESSTVSARSANSTDSTNSTGSLSRIARLFGATGSIGALCVSLAFVGVPLTGGAIATAATVAPVAPRFYVRAHAVAGRSGVRNLPRNSGVIVAIGAPALDERDLDPESENSSTSGTSGTSDTSAARVKGVDGAWLAQRNGVVTTMGSVTMTSAPITDPDLDPVVGIAGASNSGFWMTTARGRVVAVGADYHGSLDLESNSKVRVVGIAAHNAGGYWLLTSDGAVHGFGDATESGGLSRRSLGGAVIGIAAAVGTDGYYVATRNGAVFAFGQRVRHFGDPRAFRGLRIVGIAADPDGAGYWLSLDTGAVLSYGAGRGRPGFDNWTGAPAIAVVARAGHRFTTLHGPPDVDAQHPFLACTRSHESSHTPPLYADGYRAVSASGRYRGAYQFSRQTWDTAAGAFGRPDLVGVDPINAPSHDQDHLALLLYRAHGAAPWMGRCSGL